MNKLTEQQIAEIEARAKRAFTEVVEISKDSDKNFRMSIPVQPTDSDRVLIATCDDVETLATALREAYTEMEGWEPADAPELDLNEGLKRVYLEAEAELQQLRDETRWRLPNEAGRWEELPVGFQEEADVTVLITDEPEYDNKAVHCAWWDEDFKIWRYANCNTPIEDDVYKVTAWRCRAKPYTPPTEGENSNGL